MKLRLRHLQLVNKQSVEIIEFAERLSFFHGEMSSGKSTIPALIDFCLGGRFPRTPALASELVSVQLRAQLGDNDVLIERVPDETNTIQVSWETPDTRRFQVLAPIRSTGGAPVFGDNVFVFSDLMLVLLGVDVIKVRKRTQDPDSSLVRLSFRDILEFVYLDQDHLDSDFFLLDQPIRREKSQDTLRYFAGYVSERLNDLQNKLQDVRQQQRAKREAVAQIKSFLSRFEFGSEEKITGELDALRGEASGLEEELAA
jgi:AAA domain